MSSNQNKRGKKDEQNPRRRNLIIAAVLWAVVLVIFFHFLASEISNAGTQEVPYSQFIQMVEEDKVGVVELAKKFGQDNSGQFINGILAKFARE